MRPVYRKNYKYIIVNNKKSSKNLLFRKFNINPIYESCYISVYYVASELTKSIISSLKIEVFLKLMDDYYLLYITDYKIEYKIFINEFFTYISSNYENIIDTSRNINNIRILESIIKNKLCDSDTLKILDFGCGTGLSFNAISKNHELVGVDSCEMMLKKARSRGLNAFNISEFDSMFSSEYFDAIISSYVFHLIKDLSIINLVWEKLKKDGLFVGNFHKNKNVDIFKDYFTKKCQNISFLNEDFFPENGKYVIVVK